MEGDAWKGAGEPRVPPPWTAPPPRGRTCRVRGYGTVTAQLLLCSPELKIFPKRGRSKEAPKEN